MVFDKSKQSWMTLMNLFCNILPEQGPMSPICGRLASTSRIYASISFCNWTWVSPCNLDDSFCSLPWLEMHCKVVSSMPVAVLHRTPRWRNRFSMSDCPIHSCGVFGSDGAANVHHGPTRSRGGSS